MFTICREHQRFVWRHPRTCEFRLHLEYLETDDRLLLCNYFLKFQQRQNKTTCTYLGTFQHFSSFKDDERPTAIICETVKNNVSERL